MFFKKDESKIAFWNDFFILSLFERKNGGLCWDLIHFYLVWKHKIELQFLPPSPVFWINLDSAKIIDQATITWENWFYLNIAAWRVWILWLFQAMVTRFSSISTRKLSNALKILTFDKCMVATSDYNDFHKMVKGFILRNVLGAPAQVGC